MAEEFTKQKGVRHSDRLLRVLLGIAENNNEDARTRLDAAKLAEAILVKRAPPRRDKKKEAIEKMIGKSKAPR